MNPAVNLEDGDILLCSYDFNNIPLSFRLRLGGGGVSVPLWLSIFKRKIRFHGLSFL